ncbi:MAG: DUF167 domain-containing protein [Phycisphaerae bacterium]|nr:DUF167 domain-containing protein [Planctomycetota bacterium]MBL7220480.1 DUF167 domain-containing protein [Phycisphaerae bacterium]
MKDFENIAVRDVDGGAVISVKAVPGASRDRVAGVLGGCLKIATSSAAEKGRANTAIAKTLAGALGVGRRDVEIVAGTTSPRKEFRIAGVSASDVRQRLSKSD